MIKSPLVCLNSYAITKNCYICLKIKADTNKINFGRLVCLHTTDHSSKLLLRTSKALLKICFWMIHTILSHKFDMDLISSKIQINVIFYIKDCLLEKQLNRSTTGKVLMAEVYITSEIFTLLLISNPNRTLGTHR